VGHNSRVRLNAAHGNGYSDPADDFGIGVIGAASGNFIDENTIIGNTNGLRIEAGTRATVVRENTIVGNPAIQTGAARPEAQAVDILNLAPAGQTTFERNVCVTSVNAPCPAITNGGRPQD
jgi:parallel beta-helix repeat protein